MGTMDRGAMQAYEAIAPVYDEFTTEHDFDLWLGNLLPAIEVHGLPNRGLLDVACGTGKSFLPMLKRGWTVRACDISPAMVAKAAAKVGPNDSAVVSVADMRALPRFGEFGLVWCLTDPLNYLLTDGELDAALAGLVGNLHPEGLLVFDVNTLLSFQTFFAEEVVVESTERRLVWRGKGSPTAAAGSIAEATFLVEEDLGADFGSAPTTIHRVRHFPESTMLAALEKAGAEIVDVFGIHYDAVPKRPLVEQDHTKAIYVARKAGAKD